MAPRLQPSPPLRHVNREPTPKTADISETIKTTGAKALKAAGTTVLAGFGALQRAIITAGNLTDRFLTNDPDTPQQPAALATRVANGVRSALHRATAAAEQFEFINGINTAALPPLLDDLQQDRELKLRIYNQLRGDMAAETGLADGISTIVVICFNRGINAEKVINFLESEPVRMAMVEGLLKGDQPVPNGPTAISRTGARIRGLGAALIRHGTELEQHPVNKAMAATLHELIDDFRASYDATDHSAPMSGFVRSLIEGFPNIRIREWLVANQKKFADILKGGELALDDEDNEITTPYHIRNVVHESYALRGKDSPEEYIKMYLPDFFYPHINEHQYILDVAGLRHFFYTVLPKIHSDRHGSASLRAIIIRIITLEVLTDEDAVLVKENGNEPKLLPLAPKERNQKLKETIYRHAKSPTSNGLLEDPENTPNDETKELYSKWFTKDGELSERAYHRSLVLSYGIDGEEDTDNIKLRVSNLLRQADDFVKNQALAAGIPAAKIQEFIMVTSRVARATDLATLIDIEYNSPSEAERYAARRKREYARLIWRCQVPRLVFGLEDAQLAQSKQESLKKYGIQINPNAEPVEATVTDYQDGSCYVCIEDSEMQIGKKLFKRRDRNLKIKHSDTIDLVPGKLFGIEGFFTFVEQNEDGYVLFADKGNDAILNKLTRKPETDIHTMTDLARCAFITDKDKLPELKRRAREYFIISAANGEYVDAENPENNIYTGQSGHVNPDSDPSMTTNKIVMDHAVLKDEHVMQVRTELQFDTPELLFNYSKYDQRSHRRYERKRARRIMPVLAPPNLRHFRERLYVRNSKGDLRFKNEKELEALKTG